MRAKIKASSTSYFGRWTRKSWAAFGSLGKTIKISALSVSILVALSPKQAKSQSDTSKVFENKQLEEFIVNDEIVSGVAKNNSRLVQIIGSKEISESPARCLADLLSSVPTIDIRQRGINDAQADVSIRGGTFEQVVVLINGIRYNNPQTGHFNLDLPFDISMIDHIEIVSGSAARIFGPNSFSGAINIITKKPKKSQANISLGAGSFQSYSSSANIGLKNKNHSNSLALNIFKSNGHIKNTDQVIGSGFYQGGIFKKDFLVEWQASISAKDFGANSFYSPKYPDQYEENRALGASANYKLLRSWTLSGQIFTRAHSDMFQLFRDGIEKPTWYAGHNYHLSWVNGFNQTFSKSDKFGVFTLGISAINEQIKSNVLGIKLLETIANPIYSEANFTKQAQRNSIFGFAEHSFGEKNLQGTLGTLLYFNDFTMSARFFPGLDMKYYLTNKSKIILNLSTAIRLPSFTELYYFGPTNLGNEKLKPEENKSINLSYIINNHFLRTTASGYFIKSKNLIDWIRSDVNEKWVTSNISRSSNIGGELSFVFNNLGKIGYILGLTPASIAVSSSKVFYESDGKMTNYSSDYTKLKFSATINQKITRKINISYNLIYVSRNGQFPLYNLATKTEVMTNYGSHVNLDISLNIKYKLWIFQLSARNILNQKYYEIGNVIMPGFNGNLKVSKSINL